MALAAALSLAGAAAAQPSGGQSSDGGRQVFTRWCSGCHARGARYAGTVSLAVKYGKSKPAALEDRQDLTPEIVAYFVRHGVGFMPPFRKTEITDPELKMLGAYLSKASGK